METDKQDRIALKWGTLKAWSLHSDKALELLKQWYALGVSVSAILQQDTPEQKKLVCQIIDESNAETVYLCWDGIHVPKEKAKKYVREYRS